MLQLSVCTGRLKIEASTNGPQAKIDNIVATLPKGLHVWTMESQLMDMFESTSNMDMLDVNIN